MSNVLTMPPAFAYFTFSLLLGWWLQKGWISPFPAALVLDVVVIVCYIVLLKIDVSVSSSSFQFTSLTLTFLTDGESSIWDLDHRHGSGISFVPCFVRPLFIIQLSTFAEIFPLQMAKPCPSCPRNCHVWSCHRCVANQALS